MLLSLYVYSGMIFTAASYKAPLNIFVLAINLTLSAVIFISIITSIIF